MAVGKSIDFDAGFDNLFSELEVQFAGDRVYTDIIDWYDNGGIDKEALGIEITEQQRTILASYYGCQLTEKQESILEYWKAEDRTSYDFDFGPTKRNNLVVEAGRRSGKSFIGSLIICYEFEKLCRMDSPQKSYGVASSTLISIICIATSAEQTGKTIYGQARAMMYNCPFLRRLIELKKIDPQEKMIKYPEKLLYVYSGNSKGETQVGGSPILLVLDEGAMFQDAEGKSNALDLWDTLGAGGLVFKEDAKRIIISSAAKKGDALEVLYPESKTMQTWLGFRLKTWQMNPVHGSRDNPIIASMYTPRSRQAAELMYEGIRQHSTNPFFDVNKVESAFDYFIQFKAHRQEVQDHDMLVKNTVDHVPEFFGKSAMHLDPAVSKDNYGLAFGHSEYIDGNLHVFIDGIMAWEPVDGAHVSIMNVQDAVIRIHASQQMGKVTSDDKESAETFQRFRVLGINAQSYRMSNPKQVLMYNVVETLLNEGRLHLPKNSPWTSLLKDEMFTVELNPKRDKIDHPVGGTKDVIDCVAGVCLELAGSSVQLGGLVPSTIKVSARTEKKEKLRQPDNFNIDRKTVISAIKSNRTRWSKGSWGAGF